MNQYDTVTIESLAYGGDGVAHLEGRVLFIPGALPGDVVQIRIIQDKGSYLRGELVEIISLSPDRVESSCRYSSRCGGCQWQELSYQSQLGWKRAIVEESLRRLGGVDGIEVEKCIPSPVINEYRTIARYPARHTSGGLVMGYHQRRTHSIVDIETCPMASKQVNRIAQSIRALPFIEPLDLLEITIQASYNLPTALVKFTLRKPASDLTAIGERILSEIDGLSGVSFVIETSPGKTRHLLTLGTPYRYERVRGKTFRIEERSFFQINIPQTENLVELAGDMLQYKDGEVLADCYGGVGLFSLSLAPSNSGIYLFDVSAWAVGDSRFNASEMGYSNFTGIVSDADKAFSVIGEADILIIDPPRTGLGLKAVEEMSRFKAKRMVYVSCNPTTMARDISYFFQRGYRAKRIVPIDMFPNTYHIETVALLENV
jgi:23S rRNA (uracil1939-C5)-methyltransferase